MDKYVEEMIEILNKIPGNKIQGLYSKLNPGKTTTLKITYPIKNCRTHIEYQNIRTLFSFYQQTKNKKYLKKLVEIKTILKETLN